MRYEYSEIEVRFLEIDKDQLIKRLLELRAKDLGVDLLEEVIFYDKELEWKDGNRKMVRIRKTKTGISLTYKHQEIDSATGTEEIEFGIDDQVKAEVFLERIGLVAFRHQQKKRRTFKLDNVTVDIDTWPKVPPYVELEGASENDLKQAAKKLKLDWDKAVFENPRTVIEKYYKIPVRNLHWFTFDKIDEF